jgi:hypothetical protein
METSGSMKSPIICPDPDSGIGSNGSPRNRSGNGEKTAGFAEPDKPESCPDQPVSPVITAGQKIVSPEKWGMFQPFCMA